MNSITIYDGPLGLDRVGITLKWANWLISLALVLLVAYRLWDTRPHGDWGWLVVVAPSFIAVAWLRFTGNRWRYVLFFPVIAVCAAFILWIAYFYYFLIFHQ